MNKSEKSNYYSNIGEKRNKTPLQNICYKIEVSFGISTDFEKYKKVYPNNTEEDFEEYKLRFEPFKFKDQGYIFLNWKYEKEDTWSFYGCITSEELKERLGIEQYRKFCNGKREFIIQRRINGKNI